MSRDGASLTYVGAGGNIGSHAVVALVRTGRFARVTLVDHDRYEARNLASQDIARRDLGRRKVDVLAARLRRIDPGVRIETVAEPVERVPLGRLRADVVATGLDGLASRRVVNRAAWRLGLPWVDAGVRAEGLLARVDVFEPAEDAGCLECSWNAREIAALDDRYPCDPPAAPAPTGAPAWLGGLAGSLQCAECVALLARGAGRLPHGRQILVDAAAHRHDVSTRRRAADCGFDHRRWSTRPLRGTPGSITLGQASRLVPAPHGEPVCLRVHGDHFVRRLACPGCGASREVVGLAGRMPEAARACAACGATMAAPGFDTTDALDLRAIAGPRRRLSLYALGLRAGDVFGVETAAGETPFEIGAVR